jgi:hypothetical protein
MKTKLTSPSGNMVITSNDLGIYTLKVESEGSTESLWLDKEEITELRNLLNLLENENEA